MAAESRKYQKAKKQITAQLAVNERRLKRKVSRLATDDVLSVYEEGSNMCFHGPTGGIRAKGALLLDAAVSVLKRRLPQIAKLDLSKPFPLRNWVYGIPVSDGLHK